MQFSYSRLMAGLSQQNIGLNRKVISELAMNGEYGVAWKTVLVLQGHCSALDLLRRVSVSPELSIRFPLPHLYDMTGQSLSVSRH